MVTALIMAITTMVTTTIITMIMTIMSLTMRTAPLHPAIGIEEQPATP
jgi:hypothetical protein